MEQTASQQLRRLLSRVELLLALLIVPTVLAVAWVSQQVQPSPQVHAAAQFVHLASVVVGLGCVLAVDWFGLRWQFGRSSLEQALAAAGALTAPIWFGLMGLLASGMFLEPDLSSTATRIKVGLVAGTGLVGVAALVTKRQLVGVAALVTNRQLGTTTPPRRPGMIRRALLLAITSQACWWGATVIGFLNRTA